MKQNDLAECEKPFQTRLFDSGANKATETAAKEVNDLHQEFVGHLTSSLEKGMRIGEILTRQKEKLDHGEFMPWVERNLDFDHRSATRYISLYKHRAEFKMDNVSNLNSAYKYIKRLTYPGQKTFGEESKEKLKIIISPDDSQSPAIEMGLERAREILDSDSVTFAFYYIIDEWLEMNSDKSELPPIEEKIRVLEKIYGVKLIIQRNEGA